MVSENIYGNILEALIAAIYLDLGHQKSKEFVVENIIKKTVKKQIKDYKSKIFEWSQKNKKRIKFINNETKFVGEKKHFARLLLDGKELSRALGRTKKSAEQKSAEIAYNIVS